jgi:hypothetical protein
MLCGDKYTIICVPCIIHIHTYYAALLHQLRDLISLQIYACITPKSHVDLKERDEDERTSLHWASASGHVNVLEYLHGEKLVNQDIIDMEDDGGI